MSPEITQRAEKVCRSYGPSSSVSTYCLYVLQVANDLADSVRKTGGQDEIDILHWTARAVYDFLPFRFK